MKTHLAHRFTAFLLLAVVLLLPVIGCGPGTGDLTGTISHKGKPVTSGSISAVGSDGVPHACPIAANGQYKLTGLPVGEVKITVASPNPTTIGRGGAGGHGGGPAGRAAGRDKESRALPKREDPEPDPEVAKGWFPIPESYADIAKTSLRATVKAGVTQHDVDLP